jgi:uncharacterized protein YjbI with pentapeptide repeats
MESEQEKQLRFLQEGGENAVRTWNDWRNSCRALSSLNGIDLHGKDLRRVSFWEADLSKANFHHAKLSVANFRRACLLNACFQRAKLAAANFSGADLKGADLSNSNLRGANLSGANLEGANVRSADLTGATLSHTVLVNANLDRTTLASTTFTNVDMRGAFLSDSDLRNANLMGVNLTDATLHGANFSNAECDGINFRNANLTEADMTACRLVRCDLGLAILERVLVADLQIFELQGIPCPPAVLRLTQNGEHLVGQAAQSFFMPSSRLEIFVSERLCPEELACFHLHLAELHHHGVARSVFLVGNRHERGGSVLRFQSTTLEAILLVIPDLLAPFWMAQAIDWTLSSVNPVNALDKVRNSLIPSRRRIDRWKFAERMAEVFSGYRNAKVFQIVEGRSRGIRIDVYTNHEIADKLATAGLPPTWNPTEELLIAAGATSSIQVNRTYNMGHKVEVHGDAINLSLGDASPVHARDINLDKSNTELSAIGDEIKTVIQEAVDMLQSLSLKPSDKSDAVENVQKIAEELEKAEPDASRVTRCWRQIRELAPTVSSLLSSATMVAKILQITH